MERKKGTNGNDPPSLATGRLTNRTKSMLNLGSYNYLGFADDWGATCKTGVMPVLDALPVGCSINRRDFGESAAGEEFMVDF